VCCAISHDAHGQLLNTNADTVAAGLATALSEQYEVVLNYCFEKKGVLQNIEDEHSIIPEINFELYRKLKSEGVIAEGMLPKLHNCFQALKNGVKEVRIGNPMILSTEKQFTKIIY
jgi:acetylglutamate kinase